MEKFSHNHHIHVFYVKNSFLLHLHNRQKKTVLIEYDREIQSLDKIVNLIALPGVVEREMRWELFFLMSKYQIRKVRASNIPNLLFDSEFVTDRSEYMEK